MPNVSELAREEAKAAMRGTPEEPYVGMLATYVIGPDQYAGILIEVSKSGHEVLWARVDVTASEFGRKYAWVLRCSLRSDGEYAQVGSKHGYLKLGVAKTILDEGF